MAVSAGSDAGQDNLTVSVVVCTYSDQRFGDLTAAVASLWAQSRVPEEIIVAVDRNPGLLERVKREIPEAIVVPNVQHPGAGGARNSGVAVATGSIIAFIDDDVETPPEWLEKLLPAFADDAVLGAGGSISPIWASSRPSWFPEEFDWVIGCTYRGLPSHTAEVRNVISANMAVRRDVFDGIGGFLPGFGKQAQASEPEETEFCIRAGQRWPQRKWLYVPDAHVRHRVTPVRETFRYFLTRCKNEGVGKARLSELRTSQASLSSEKAYVAQVLPSGVVRNLGSALRGELSGLGRAATIVVGVSVTAAGWALGSLASARNARAAPKP